MGPRFYEVTNYCSIIELLFFLIFQMEFCQTCFQIVVIKLLACIPLKVFFHFARDPKYIPTLTKIMNDHHLIMKEELCCYSSFFSVVFELKDQVCPWSHITELWNFRAPAQLSFYSGFVFFFHENWWSVRDEQGAKMGWQKIGKSHLSWNALLLHSGFRWCICHHMEMWTWTEHWCVLCFFFISNSAAIYFHNLYYYSVQ